MSQGREVFERRAAALCETPRQVPNGAARSRAFKAEMRSSTVIWNGQERYFLEGYASVVEKRYRMYDMFGEYDEIVDARAFDWTLSKSPDVAYLVNHRGVTMARTTNGSLELAADGKGLRTGAYVNPKRQDVKDIVIAIDDRDVTEMSFAFQILEGEWNEDYTEFRILKVDLDRGDVSAVNYGASPHTSVAARQSQILSDLPHLPAGARRAAMELLSDDDFGVAERQDISATSPEPPASSVEEMRSAFDSLAAPAVSSVELYAREFSVLYGQD